MQSLILALIRCYQRYLSVWLGPQVCRFHPTCSQYTYGAIAKYGVLKGGWLGLVKISHCHPWYHE